MLLVPVVAGDDVAYTFWVDVYDWIRVLMIKESCDSYSLPPYHTMQCDDELMSYHSTTSGCSSNSSDGVLFPLYLLSSCSSCS